jgi:hypothetical protein
MPDQILFKICGTRRARRTCPAVQGDICTICCGTEREVSLSCPLECVYLQEAHRREKPIALAEKQLSNPGVQVSEEFLRDHEELMLFCIYSLVQGAARNPGAIDADILAALEASIQTQRTLESGLVYETRPENAVAAGVQRSFEASLADCRKERAKRDPFSPLRNADMLKLLVFLHRLGQQNQNGRPRGRMYLDLLRQMTPEQRVEDPAPSIIL